LKDGVIAAYGGKCVCCGETIRQFLTIDHKNGGGTKHREEMFGGATTGLYRWLKKHNYPPEYQVLCFNCNCAKGFHGECPHETARRKQREAQAESGG